MSELFTRHQYIGRYPIEQDSRKLILGTIHAMNPSRFKIDFFYGNKGTLWSILHKAFPSELTDPASIGSIRGFLHERKIAMSDVILECGRRKATALDADLTDIRLHEELLPQIRRSAITDIYFTSGWGTNNAFKLFYTGLLKQPVTDEIRAKRMVVLDASFFGRPVTLHILHSPSGAANIALSRHPDYVRNKGRYEGVKGPVQAYKVDYYREMFGDG